MFARPHVGGVHRSHRVEVGLGQGHLLVLVEDVDELSEVRSPPIPPGTFTLFEDGVHGLLRAGKVGDRDEIRPSERRLCGLGPGWADEQPLLAVLLRECCEAGFDGAVEMSDGAEILQPGNDVPALHGRHSLLDGGKTVGIVELHAFWAFEEHEVRQGGLAER